MCKTIPRTAFGLLFVALSYFSLNAAGQSPPAQPDPLDVKDVSFLWPVPAVMAEVEALISLNDEATDGKLFPDELWANLIDDARTVGDARIFFPNEAVFKKTTHLCPSPVARVDLPQR